MKRARFLVDGRVAEGHLAEPGVLIDSDGGRHDEAQVTFLPPLDRPGKILGLALNYADHATELGLHLPDDPAIFFKPSTALIGHRGEIIYPRNAKYLHYENELAAVIGRRCRRVPRANALDVVAGYTIANDVTCRDFVTNTFRPPIKGKGWDTFLPLGPYLVEDEIDDPQSLGLRTYVNGELRQEGTTALQVTTLAELIEYLSEFMTLEPGDLLMTGTPAGLSHIFPGDSIRLEVDGLGALESTVVAESVASEAQPLNL